MNVFKKTGLYLKGAGSYFFNPTGLGNNEAQFQSTNVSWFGISGGYSAHSDAVLLKEGYSSNSEVFSIINAIASESVEVGYDVQRNGEDLKKGIIYELVNEDPKEHFSYKIEKSLIELLSTGDCFIRKVKGAGFSYPLRLEVLRSSSTEILVNSNNDVIKYRYTNAGKTFSYLPEEIIHIKNYNPLEDNSGNHRGFSRLQAGYKVLSASNNRETASAHIFENLGVSGIISDKNGSLQDAEESEEKQIALFDKLKGAHKAGQFVITSAELEVHQLGMSPKDLEISKTSSDHLRKLAALFHVSSRPFNDTQGTTYNNAATDDKNFFIKGVKKPLNKIINGINTGLIDLESGVLIVPNYESVEALQADQMQEIEKQNAQSDGVIKVLTDAALEDNQKNHILVNIYGLTEEEAKKLVSNG